MRFFRVLLELREPFIERRELALQRIQSVLRGRLLFSEQSLLPFQTDAFMAHRFNLCFRFFQISLRLVGQPQRVVV